MSPYSSKISCLGRRQQADECVYTVILVITAWKICMDCNRCVASLVPHFKSSCRHLYALAWEVISSLIACLPEHNPVVNLDELSDIPRSHPCSVSSSLKMTYFNDLEIFFYICELFHYQWVDSYLGSKVGIKGLSMCLGILPLIVDFCSNWIQGKWVKHVWLFIIRLAEAYLVSHINW